MLARLFKRGKDDKKDHVEAVARCVEQMAAQEPGLSPDLRRAFWEFHGPKALGMAFAALEPHVNEIVASGESERIGLMYRLEEYLAIREALEDVPDTQYSVNDPNCLRCLVFSCLATYVANGPTLSFGYEWNLYTEVLARRGIVPRTAESDYTFDPDQP